MDGFGVVVCLGRLKVKSRKLKGKTKRKTNAESTEDAEFAEKRKAREERGMGDFDRRSPPFAQNAKDGAPSSTRARWHLRGNPRAQSGVTVPQEVEPKTHTQNRSAGYPAEDTEKTNPRPR